MRLLNAAWPRALLALGLLLLSSAVFYWQPLFYLLRRWSEFSEGDYGHGYLVVAISLYLVYLKRERLAALVPCPAYMPILLVLFASLLWLLAALVNVMIVQLVALPFILLGILWTIFGRQVARQLMFPVLFIFLAIPIWFPLGPFLQDLTADAAFGVIRLINVPAFLEENMIIVPAGALSVEESCGGQRYLLAALTLGTLYSYLNYTSMLARIVVIMVAAATAIVANIMRVVIVVYLGYATDMQHPMIADHMMLGWYLFGGLIAVLLFIDGALSRRFSFVDDGFVAEPAVSHTGCSVGCPSLPLPVFLLVAAVAAGPVAFYVMTPHQIDATTVSLGLPVGDEGWKGPLVSSNNWHPVYTGAVTVRRDYQLEDSRVSLYIAYYVHQQQGSELVNMSNKIAEMEDWSEVYAHPRSLKVNGRTVLEQRLRHDKTERIVWYWYNIGGRVTVSRYAGKVLQLAGLVIGRPEAYLVAVSTQIKTDISASRQVLERFVLDMHKPLDAVSLTGRAVE